MATQTEDFTLQVKLEAPKIETPKHDTTSKSEMFSSNTEPISTVSEISLSKEEDGEDGEELKDIDNANPALEEVLLLRRR
jgi:hypothetical protein